MVKYISIIVTFAAVMVFSNTAFAFEAPSCKSGVGVGCAGDCMQCHSLSKEDAFKLLKAEKFGVQVKDIRLAPIKGLWEVELEKEGKTFLAYIDFARKHLVQGNFVPLGDIGKLPAMRKLDIGKIPLQDAIVMGSENAKIKIIVFDDPDCPYCAKLHPELKKIIEKRKDIAFYLKLYPLPIHPEAYDKARTILCEKSVKLLEDVFEGKKIPPPNSKCEAKAIDENIKLAQELGINGTPAIIFPDGRLWPGFAEANMILEILESKEN